MGVIFNKALPGPTDEEFVIAEKKMARRLPESLKEHLRAANGGIPDRAYFPFQSESCIWIARFLSVARVGGSYRSLEETYCFGIQRGFLPENLIPFAVDHGGNYLCIDENERICFFTMDDWDEDLAAPANMAKAEKPIAASLAEFVGNLRADCD